MRARLAAVLLFAAALAGCATEEAIYELRGTYTEDANRTQRDELAGAVTERGGRMAELESFPVQFHATGLAPDACQEVASMAQDAAYVQEVGDCQLETGGEAAGGG